MAQSVKLTHPHAAPGTGNDERLALLEQIAQLIAKAKSLNLTESAFLLGMTHLELQTKIYNINEDEMQSFMNVVRSSMERH